MDGTSSNMEISLPSLEMPAFAQQQHAKGPCCSDLPMRHTPGGKEYRPQTEEDMVIYGDMVAWYPHQSVKPWAIS